MSNLQPFRVKNVATLVVGIGSVAFSVSMALFLSRIN